MTAIESARVNLDSSALEPGPGSGAPPAGFRHARCDRSRRDARHPSACDTTGSSLAAWCSLDASSRLEARVGLRGWI